MRYRAGMFGYALAFLSGVVFVQQLAVLPELSSLITLLLSSSLLWLVSRLANSNKNLAQKREYTLIKYYILLFIIGYVYAVLYANQRLSFRLDENYIGSNLLVSGDVSGVPVTDGHIQRFDFNIKSYRILTTNNNGINHGQTMRQFPQKLRLSWYYAEQVVYAGETWQFEVRLKPPHGFMNPGGFDYEAWLFQHGIHATGYVRQSALNRPLSDNLSSITFIGKVNSIRQAISQQIDIIANRHLRNTDKATDETGSFALVKALAIGHKSSISNRYWQVLINTGTSHLMAISGLHIGLASLFAFVFIRRAVPAFIMKWIPAQHIAVTGGMIAALIYALIAGLSVSTQRAIIMLSVLSMMMLVRRNHRPVDALGFALLIVLLFDPLAVLSAGFWFSFSAVAVIFISLNSDRPVAGKFDSSVLKPGSDANAQQQNSSTASIWSRAIITVKQWVRLQLLISVFLLPLSLFMFQQVSLVSPIANFLLIPYVSFLVVPLVLLALACNFLFPGIAEMLFVLAASLLDFVWPVLSLLSALPHALWINGNVDVVSLSGATLGMLLIFFSKRIISMAAARIAATGTFNRQQLIAVYSSLLIIAGLMVAPIFITTSPHLERGEYQLTMLDVGQGSAAVLVTQNHLMVFDAGAKFSDRLDAGSNVVIPCIRSAGHDAVDYLVISHGDADHIGGAQAILDEYPATTVIGQDIENLAAKNKSGCFAGIQWQWDGVDFEFLSPFRDDISLFSSGRRNNHSCVLRVSSAAGAVLLAGDIEESVESRLLQKYGEKLASNILLVPHHGSKTSSSAAFLAAVDPEIALFSVGYNNRYGFPDSQVMQRYRSLSSRLLRTDKSGAIIISLVIDDGIVVEKYRGKARKYWHH